MYRPGLFTLPNENALDAVNLARRLAADALAALDAGRLVINEGSLSQGWVEVFPELTEDDRRLGQLPGFTPERIDQWLESYPAEVLGLPSHTGSPLSKILPATSFLRRSQMKRGRTLSWHVGMRRSPPQAGIRLGTTAARATG
jgi:hypothetical protein